MSVAIIDSMCQKLSVDILILQIICQILPFNLILRESIAHKLEAIQASVLDFIIFISRLLKELAPMNQRAWVLCRNLPIWLALIVPGSTTCRPDTVMENKPLV